MLIYGGNPEAEQLVSHLDCFVAAILAMTPFDLSTFRPFDFFMSHFHTNAIVLHTFPYGDKDLIARLLTVEGELISCFAKGAQNSQKRFGPALDVLNQVVVMGWFDLILILSAYNPPN